MTQQPNRGDVWIVDLDPTKGHEQAGKRPCLVISVDIFNQGPADLVMVLPITTKAKMTVNAADKTESVRASVNMKNPFGDCTRTAKPFIRRRR